MLFARQALGSILEALEDTRIVYLMGARQVGKSTLVREIAAGPHPAEYVSLDDVAILDRVRDDPIGFVRSRSGPVVIDEAQRAPELLLEIKRDVDLNPVPGRYLLTGSANLLTAPNVIDTLTGRVELIRLWPLSQGEIDGRREKFVDSLLAGDPVLPDAAPRRDEIAMRIVRGGFPEAFIRRDFRRRSAWFRAHIETALSQDLAELASLRKLTELPRLLGLLAGRAGNIVQIQNVSRDLGMSRETVKSYIDLLETLFVFRRLPAWRPGVSRRAVHAPKGYIVDSGMHAHLVNVDETRILDDPRVSGIALENFVAMEVLRQSEWADGLPMCHHFRDRDGAEVDLVLEDAAGRIAGIEVKATATVRAASFRGLERLRRLAGERFAGGILLHLGDDAGPVGEGIWSAPVSALWA